MPSCRRDCDNAALEIMTPEEKATPTQEWHEPPGRLGEFVRRVKRLSVTRPWRADGGAA